MSAALPKSLEISYRKAATWLQRCFHNGGGAWRFLSRVLRVYYGVIVCGGNHEPLLDLRTNLICNARKVDSCSKPYPPQKDCSKSSDPGWGGNLYKWIF